MALENIVDPLTENTGKPMSVPDPIVSWVVNKTDPWREWRNNNYEAKWKEYYRLWRGVWAEQDRTRQVERSKIIAPALQQAIESNVAELEESIFHRIRWFDMEDDVYETRTKKAMQTSLESGGNEQQALEAGKEEFERVEDLTSQLLDDFELECVQKSISETFLNGALYGNGIGKLVVEVREERVPKEGSAGMSADVEIKRAVRVRLVSVLPSEFLIDPVANSCDEGLGCAHEYLVPRHEVLRKQAKKIYLDRGFLGSYTEGNEHMKEEQVTGSQEFDRIEILEYHGLVPKGLIDLRARMDYEEFSGQQSENFVDDSADLVEAIVVIANRSVLLKATLNPFIMQDRSFVSYQHDTVPGRFWGRGTAEKGYNPQKALDTELRARIDSLALSTYPMMVVNGLLSPRNADYSVRPGRNIIVNGNPTDAIAPFKFPEPDSNTFRQTADLERMITMATGAMDSAAPLGVNPRNETASGISMILGSVLKRTKRTLRNIETQFLKKFVQKAMWRYMQFDTERYPVADYKFKVYGIIGSQAREFEVGQLTQLMNSAEPTSPSYWMFMKGVLRNFNIDGKEELMEITDKMLQQSLNPQPPPPDPMVVLKEREIVVKEKDLQFRIDQSVEVEMRKDKEVEAEAVRDRGEAIWNQSEAVLNIAKAKTEKVKALADIIDKMSKASSQEGGMKLKLLLAQAKKLVTEAGNEAQTSPLVKGVETSVSRQADEETTPDKEELPPEVVANTPPPQGAPNPAMMEGMMNGPPTEEAQPGAIPGL